jgi:hypothetical protein
MARKKTRKAAHKRLTTRTADRKARQPVGLAEQGNPIVEDLITNLDALLVLRQYDAAWDLSQTILERRPLWVSAQTRLAEIAWQTCRLDTAEHTLRSILSQEPGHPVSRLALLRLLLLGGRLDEARPLVQHLADSTIFDHDPALALELTIVSDQLTGSGSDQQAKILDLVHRHMRQQAAASGYFKHLVAATQALCGDSNQARLGWQSISGLAAEDWIVKRNLQDMANPANQRLGPFIFKLADLLPDNCIFLVPKQARPLELHHELAIDKILAAIRTRAAPLVRGLGRCLMLYGDPIECDCFMRRLVGPWLPELLDYFRDIGQQQLAGERRQVIMRSLDHASMRWGCGHEPAGDPAEPPVFMDWTIIREPFQHNEQFDRQFEQAYRAWEDGDNIRATQSYTGLLKHYPDEPSIWQNLRVCLSAQGNQVEVDRLGQEMQQRFPYYIHVQLEQAARFHKNGDTDKAWRILHGQLARQIFHANDLRHVMRAAVDFNFSEERYADALSWLEVWKRFEREPECMKPYEPLTAISAFKQLIERNTGRRRKNQAEKAAAGRREQRSQSGIPSSRKQQDQLAAAKRLEGQNQSASTDAPAEASRTSRASNASNASRTAHAKDAMDAEADPQLPLF